MWNDKFEVKKIKFIQNSEKYNFNADINSLNQHVSLAS